jgi:D-alanine-D-alanine ligase
MSVNKLRVLALVHRHLIPPDTVPEGTDITSEPWRTEYDVVTTLRAMGHEVQVLGVHDDLGEIRRITTEWKPHIAFNLLEGFDDITIFDMNVVSFLELLKLPYTGCNSRGLLLARDKSLSKKLLAYHRIAVPEFEVFRVGRPMRRPKRLPFPLMVKSLTQEASIGISQASVVDSDEKLKERVAFIHESIGTAAIVEQYIEGRELYVGILGNQRCRRCRSGSCSSPTCRRRQAHRHRSREVERQVPEEVRDRQRDGQRAAEGRPSASSTCASARIRALELSGYARIDLRLDEAGNAWVLEANPNPQIARGEDFVDSAEKIGLSYETVLQRIINLGLKWQPESVA